MKKRYRSHFCSRCFSIRLAQPLAPQGFNMLPEHIDVDIPAVLLSQKGNLLAEFEKYVRGKGYECRRKSKRDGGKHLTPWWLIVVAHPGAPEKSKITYGETEFDEVNPNAHLWSQAKLGYREEGHNLLRGFIDMRKKSTVPPPPPPPPPPPMIVVRDFDGTAYGEEYLTLRAGDRLVSRCPPQRSEGWAYGLLLGAGCRGRGVGWYPPEFAR